MNITYVSCLYNIYPTRDTSDRLLRDVEQLINKKLKLVMFVDNFYYPLIINRTLSDTVKIVRVPIEELYIYNMIISTKEELHLPNNRNKNKDTHEYLALMNSKAEFLWRALPYINTEYAAWIDAGSSKMLHDHNSYERLCNTEIRSVPYILIPGCHQKSYSIEDLYDNVRWNYLGTFMICSRPAIDKFFKYSLESLSRFMTKRKLTWEVNVWCDINEKHPDMFKWYYSDHNDGFTIIPPQYTI